MFRIVRTRTLTDLNNAVHALQAALAAHSPDRESLPCAGDGCCGCGARLADVANRWGEGYCTRCARLLDVADPMPFDADGVWPGGPVAWREHIARVNAAGVES